MKIKWQKKTEYTARSTNTKKPYKITWANVGGEKIYYWAFCSKIMGYYTCKYEASNDASRHAYLNDYFE